MARLLEPLIGRWRDAAAVRAEHELRPTCRRRLDRLLQRTADRRALAAERRQRIRRDIDDAASIARAELLMRL